ncbi:MAG: hypothetical protein K1X72_10535 [Pyrinomonadaceae bacterium]|nr:hypothetical protein [Pyrinomonadaceae bacterium]
MKKLLSLILLMICSINLWANVAAPSQGGQTLTEPSGIKNINILKEDLNIDFTQLGDEAVSVRDRFINVEAIYQIDNPADIEKLELVFVIVSDAKNFQFFLDDKEIPTETVDNEKFADRSTWKKPDKTPYKDRQLLMYNPYNGNLKSAKFTLNLTKGKHSLKAKYKAEPTVYKNIGIMKGWQFAYSLAPVRDWKSFGGLNLTIKIPENWNFYSNLNLEQNGGTLTGNFKEIPADYLAATTQAPVPDSYKTWSDITFFIFLGCLFVVPVLLIIFAVWKGYKWKNSWAYGLLAGTVWALLVGISGFFSQSFPKGLIPEGQFASYGYDDLFSVFFMVLLIPIVFVLGIVFWITAIWLAGKRKA